LRPESNHRDVALLNQRQISRVVIEHCGHARSSN
jgi:hypothetical protein